MSQSFDQRSAIIINSPQGNIDSSFSYVDSSDVRRLVSMLEEWLDETSCDESSYAKMSKLHRMLKSDEIASAKKFFKRNTESIAASLAGSALWSLLVSVLGGVG